ncbi:coiled-coil domain-containing glutamate-rich protein 1 [Choloepus didactylus]|uniref:coiled-coil domain-containing glutamate-rich protein 1 n=1 Tax=Choloepus didactylus TaxID=27675 RepID=UPI00189D0A72|nr:coiled-coil domain-containing glutamate-rich protein 1 [Choloepus didactylus]
MTQTLNKREDPLNLGGGWASSVPFRTWSCHRRRRSTPIYKRRHYYGPKAEYEPPRKQPKKQHGPGPWFQPPPRRPYWAVYPNYGPWRGHWRPPAAGFRKPPGRVQVIRMYGLHPFCLCCCSCWRGPLHPGWARPYGRKKRWCRRGRGLRRHPRRSFQRSPPVDLSMLLRPVNLYGWRAPGMRAPPNTTQFIMDQIYKDMREQEKLERQQEALRAQQAQASCAASPATSFGDDAPPSGREEDAELQETWYNFVQNPSLVFSPASGKENPSPTPQLVEEEEEEKNDDGECDEEVCEGEEEESDGEDEEAEAEEDEEEAEDEEEVAEAESVEEGEEEEEEEIEEEEEGVAEEDEQSEEENPLPLEMPLSILVGAEEDRENFVNCTYLSPKQIIPQVSQEALFMI